MELAERILKPLKRIHGGAHLPHHKDTAEIETVIMPPPNEVTIPLLQNIGKPAEPCVKKGDAVFIGTKIGEASGFVSVPVHSSISGTVKEIGDRIINGNAVKCVVIESDGQNIIDQELHPIEVSTAEDLVNAAKNCGLVGLGGAGFPAHVKLTTSPEKPIDTLIVNGAECEPYLTADYRECMEKTNDVLEGIYLIKKLLGIKKVIIGVENNKPLAIEKLYEMATDLRDTDDSVKLMELKSTYPQGAEKVIIYTTTGRIVPPGKLPSDVGCIVMNITSIATLYRYITTGMPLVSKRITLNGDVIEEPRNIQVPIGTSIADLLAFAKEECEDGAKVIMGGPMMGQPISDLSAVIEKRTNGILIMKESKEPTVTACIRCGRCAAYCPMKLFPAMVETAYNNKLYDRYDSLNINYCMECGSCSYICPAKRPLTQVMRTAKAQMRRNKK